MFYKHHSSLCMTWKSNPQLITDLASLNVQPFRRSIRDRDYPLSKASDYLRHVTRKAEKKIDRVSK